MKGFARIALFSLAAAWIPAASLPPGATQAEPVTPNASPEARALLQLLYDISGKYILTGQHNPPNRRSRNTEFASSYIGKTPIIWGSDWGHAKAGDSDSYLARPDIVQEAIRAHQRGEIVALCWHAVPPTADEPITFRPLPNSDPKALASVQGKLLDDQFRDVLTPGTELYKHWCSQVDEIAGYLKQLQDAHVPVLWRPYHEMNGDWFWWGGRTGQYSTSALYRQIFDRLVNYHHLNNLIWVWNVDRPTTPEREHARYFPGIQYLDVVALDVYGSDFNQSYYDDLVALAQGKPMALAEVGNPPMPEILDKQPRWTYYMTWAGMVRNTTERQYEVLMADPSVLSLEDAAFARVTEAYRAACHLPPLHFEPKPADFAGTWVIEEDRSDLGRFGVGVAPALMEVSQSADTIAIISHRIVESADDEVIQDTLNLHGIASKSESMGTPRVTTARLSDDRNVLQVESQANFFGSPTTVSDTWTLIDAGRNLKVLRTISSSRGTQHLTLIFRRR